MALTAADPPLLRDELVSTADEREVLAAFLDLYRDTVVRKIRGVPEVDARRQVLPSLTTLEDLLSHLRGLEIEWFQRVLGRQSDAVAGSDAAVRSETAVRSDAATRSEAVAGHSRSGVAELLASYQAACQRSREIAAGHSLHEPCHTNGSGRCRCAGSTYT